MQPPLAAPPPVVLLHGMLGATDNWDAVTPALRRAGYRVFVPSLPVYTAPLKQTSVEGLTGFVLRYLADTLSEPCVLVGNSLGGHVALCAAVQAPEAVCGLVLSGASGIHEVALGAETPRRFDRAFVRERTAFTFHDARHATDALVDQMMSVLADRAALVRLIAMARSARDTSVVPIAPHVAAPTLLIWGRQDRITPPEVAHAFARLLPRSTLAWVDACGHAPMIEHPAAFVDHLLPFLAALHRERADAPRETAGRVYAR